MGEEIREQTRVREEQKRRENEARAQEEQKQREARAQRIKKEGEDAMGRLHEKKKILESDQIEDAKQKAVVKRRIKQLREEIERDVGSTENEDLLRVKLEEIEILNVLLEHMEEKIKVTKQRIGKLRREIERASARKLRL